MKNILLLFLVAVLGVACTKLKEKPDSFLTSDQFYKTQGDAISAVNAVYYQLNAPAQSPYNVLFSTGLDMMSDDVNPGPGATNADVRSQAVLGHASTGLRVREIWQQHYAAIKRANIALDKIPGISFDEKIKSRLLGEAKFLRALFYFNLVRLYGDVPLIVDNNNSLAKEDLEVSRAPVAAVYAQIEKDLLEAADALPNTYGASDLGRATAGAAKSLLAKVYLTKREWGNAVKKAEEVINGPYGYDLFDNYSQAFLPAFKNGKEHVFSAQFKSFAQGQGNNQNLRSVLTNVPGLNGNYAEQVVFYKKGTDNWFSVYKLFSTKDKRKKATFVTSFISPNNGKSYSRLVDAKVLGDSTPFFNKYWDPASQSSLGESGANVPILRFSEVLLIHAEAENELNGPSNAYTSYNRVRTRAGLDPLDGLSQAQFRDSLYLDRRLELVFEYQRWFDLIRQRDEAGNGTLVKNLKLAGKNNASEKHYLFPIPQQEIDLNPKLTQNPGW